MGFYAQTLILPSASGAHVNADTLVDFVIPNQPRSEPVAFIPDEDGLLKVKLADDKVYSEITVRAGGVYPLRICEVASDNPVPGTCLFHRAPRPVV